jgi:hypothetical protein
LDIWPDDAPGESSNAVSRNVIAAMPIHDWTRVMAGTFHAFHLTWIAELQRALNGGTLPTGYYALAEQVAGGTVPDVLTLHGGEPGESPPGRDPFLDGPGVAVAEAPPQVSLTAEGTEAALLAARRRRVAIRHVSGDRIVAFVEIVSPGNLESRLAAEAFVDKAAEALHRGVHLLLLELVPPTGVAPAGVSGLVFEWAIGRPYDPPPDRPLTLAAFAAGEAVTAYVEPTAPGRPLADMPLFLDPGHYVTVPLERTYTAAYETLPERWRTVIEREDT